MTFVWALCGLFLAVENLGIPTRVTESQVDFPGGPASTPGPAYGWAPTSGRPPASFTLIDSIHRVCRRAVVPAVSLAPANDRLVRASWSFRSATQASRLLRRAICHSPPTTCLRQRHWRALLDPTSRECSRSHPKTTTCSSLSRITREQTHVTADGVLVRRTLPRWPPDDIAA